jgi:ketosteroid isomerase-like protein
MSQLTALLTRCAAGAAVLALMVQMPTMAQPLGEAEKKLTAIQKEWADARVKPDIAYLERLYAKEFRVQTMDGAVASRAEDIAMFKEGRIKPEFVRDEDMNISVYGDVGIVTGIEKVGGTNPSGPLKGQKAELSLRFTNVFVHRDGRWQLALSQSTQIQRNKSQ